LDGANKLGMYTIKINRSQPLYANIKNTSLYWDLEVNNLEELLFLFKTT
jgi:FMN phosphatase YigB (HAD superfamily)